MIDACDIDGKPASFAEAYTGIVALLDNFQSPSSSSSTCPEAPAPLKLVKGLRGGCWGGVYAARFPENSCGTAMTVARLGTSKAALGVFLNGAKMGPAAKIWDTTFLDSVCLHEMDKGAGPFENARIIQWHFGAAPLARRELVHCIAPVRHPGDGPERYTFVYLAVKGTPITKGFVRARMLYPSFDSLTSIANNEWNFYHSMTCHLRGWIPKWFHTHVIDGKVVSQLDSEIIHISELFENPKFQQLVVQDE